MSRHVETLAACAVKYGLQGRVAGSHLTSMHSMDIYYVSKLIPLMAEARMNVIPNPLINIMLQGRHDTYPKRRGMTRVRELMAAGLNVSFGHDCVMDPWYSMDRATCWKSATWPSTSPRWPASRTRTDLRGADGQFGPDHGP